MLLQFKLLSKLLSATRSLCYSAYLCFALATIAMIFINTTTQTYFSWIYLLSIGALCLLQHYLYVRVQFDADVLKIASESRHHTAQNLNEFSAALDQALHQLGFIPQHKMGRSWALRQHACIRLFKFQFILLIMQYIIFLFLIQHLI